MKIHNREDWLNRLSDKLRPWLAEAKVPVVHPVRLTCGWPAKGALSLKKRRIGECWPPEVSTDDHVEVFISPLLDDPLEVAGCVAHELLHAAGLKGHRKDFASKAAALGLEGPATATTPGDAFKQRIAPVLEALGPYPHARIDYTKSPRKVQTTRLLKVACPLAESQHDNGEPYIIRMSRATLDLGAPSCGICDERMIEDGGDTHDTSNLCGDPESDNPAPPEAEAPHPEAPVPQTPTGGGGKARNTEAPRKRVDPEVTQAQCAGGDGFRACRTFKGLHICARCWRRRQAIADSRGGRA